MTIEELKNHCERAIDPTNKLAFDTESKMYQEHKLILDLILEHEQKADERAKVLDEVMTIVKAKISEKEYPIKTMVELTDLGARIERFKKEQEGE